VKKTEAVATVTEDTKGSGSTWGRYFSFQNISAVYIFAIIFVLFSILVPVITGKQTFLAAGTWAALLDTQSLTVLAAIAVLIPLVSGVFNLAVGAEISFATMLCVVLQLPSDQYQKDLFLAFGLPWPIAVVITIIVGGLVGTLSGWVVTKLKIDSFIATLGMSSILTALTYLISANRPFAVPIGYDAVAKWAIPLGTFRLTLPVIVLIVVAFIAWYVLERTPVGRRMYAAGFNPDGARLSGVNVGRLQWGSLVAGGLIAGVIGTLVASKFGGTTAYGIGMLLPALAAVFLGSTQFKGGRFNIWGTVLALYVLAVGIQGFLLVKVPDWITDFFYGIALIAAVAMSRWERTAKRTKAIRQATSFTKEQKANAAAANAAEPEVAKLPPQLTPTETALKTDGIEDQGDRL